MKIYKILKYIGIIISLFLILLGLVGLTEDAKFALVLIIFGVTVFIFSYKVDTKAKENERKSLDKKFILKTILLSILIILCAINRLFLFLVIGVAIYYYYNSEYRLNKITTSTLKNTFEVKGTHIVSNPKLTEERQNRLKKFVKHALECELFEPYDGLTNKECKENSGVYYIDNDFENIFEFVDEPENEYDPNAIRVDLKNFGPIGYIEKEKTNEFRKVINDSSVTGVLHHIVGGKLKGRGPVKTVSYKCSIYVERKIKETIREKRKRKNQK